MIAAIIPCRMGSQRVPGKNALPVGGKPCWQWTFEHLKACEIPLEIVVTSDSPEVLDAADYLGCITVEEPQHVATDDNLYHCLGHAVRTVEEIEGCSISVAIMAYANMPIRPPKLFDRLLGALHSWRCDVVSTVAPCPSHWHPYMLQHRTPAGRLQQFSLGNVDINSQLFPPIYAHASAGFAYTRAALSSLFENRGNRVSLDWRAIEVEPDQCVEIDTPNDVAWAEFLLGRLAREAAR